MQKAFPYQSIARLLVVAILCALISGCGVTLSPVKRKALVVYPLETSLAPNPQKVSVKFENTLPGNPLSETVWDNASGAFADVKESKQIGFTQDYSKLVPVAAGGAAGGVIGGMVVAVSTETHADYTRILIPFGRIFQEVFQSGLQKVFTNSSVSPDDSQELEFSQAAASIHVVKLKVVEFQVWENPLNHLNLKAIVECKIYQAGKTNQPEFSYEARHQLVNQSIGSVMSTSGGFIQEMDKISNQFAATISDDILQYMEKHLKN